MITNDNIHIVHCSTVQAEEEQQQQQQQQLQLYLVQEDGNYQPLMQSTCPLPQQWSEQENTKLVAYHFIRELWKDDS